MRRNSDVHIAKMFRFMGDNELRNIQTTTLTLNAKSLYDEEVARRGGLEGSSPKDERFIVNVGYSKWTGGLFLGAAVLNLLASFTVAGASYPPLRMVLMALFALVGFRYLTGTAFSVDRTNMVITFNDLVGTFTTKVKYTGLELQGKNIIYRCEKDDQVKALPRININKEDLRILRLGFSPCRAIFDQCPEKFYVNSAG